jgi:quercetin dioxygenase-like cupin family protein
VNVGGTTIGRARFEPGWKWSEHVKPIAGTASCQAAHVGYVESGEMLTVMDDGTKLVMRQGDAVSIPPGHDAWVEGNEACVIVDFVGFAEYAKPK